MSGQLLSVNTVELQRTSKQASTARGQRLQLNGPARRVNHLRTFQSIRVGGLSLVLIKILGLTVRCHVYELVLGIGWKKLDVEAGWLGSGTMNMRKTEKVFNHNHQLKATKKQQVLNAGILRQIT